MNSWKWRLILALIVSNTVMYLYGYTAKMQVIAGQAELHRQIYSRYLVEVEKSVQKFSRIGKEEADDFSPKILSPQWIALKELRGLYPDLNFDFAPIDMDYENKPVGWTTSFEKEGWIKSNFILNAKPKQLLKIGTFSKNELDQWKKTSMFVGLLVFALFFGAGTVASLNKKNTETENKMTFLIRKIHIILVEVEFSINQLKVYIDKLEKSKPHELKTALENLEQYTNQIKILSVNGSIEGFKSVIDRKMMENLFLEINSIASKMSATMKMDFPEISDFELNTIVKRFSNMHRTVEETLHNNYKKDFTDQEAV